MGYDWQAVLLRQRGDPTIIRRDRGAGHLEPSTHFRVKWQCFLLQKKHIDIEQQGIQPSFQFGTVVVSKASTRNAIRLGKSL
jgi:hypothetical protein